MLFKYFTVSTYEFFSRTQLDIYGLLKDAPVIFNYVKCSVVTWGNENEKCVYSFKSILYCIIQGC